MLIVDATGVGRAVVDIFRSAGLRDLEAVQITGGKGKSHTGRREWNIAKVEVVGAAQAALSSGALRIGKGLPYADILMKELRDYRVKVTQSAHEIFEARQGAHDDLVLAMCLALWFAGDRGTYSAGAL